MRLHNTVTYSHLFQEIHVAQEAVGQHPPGQDRAGLRSQQERGPGRHYNAGKRVISCSLPPVLRIRIRIRIHMFLGLPDPDPSIIKPK